jgi:hypothetical protein
MGFCLPCGHLQTRFTEDEKLPSGSIIHWSERKQGDESIWVTCGRCGDKRRLSHTARCNNWSGLCQSCGGKKHFEEEIHTSGTIIHWGEHDANNPRKLIAITCHECKKKSFAWLLTIKYPNWSGRCAECRQRHGHPRKYVKDETLPSGSIIHWSERDTDNPEKRVMVTCGYYGKDGYCGKKRLTTRKSVHSSKAKNAWTGYCRKHFFDLASVRNLLLGQQNGGPEKDKQSHDDGRKVGAPFAFTDTVAFQAIDALGSDISINRLATKLKCSRATVRAWVDRKGFGSLEELIKARQKKRGWQ